MMDANYRLDISSPLGVLRHSIGWETTGDDYTRSTFKKLTCELKVNKPHRLTAVFPSSHVLLSAVEDRCQVELWEEIPDEEVALHSLFSGLYRSPQYRDYGKRGTFTLVAHGFSSLLDWRIVNYYAGYANRSVFSSKKTETIMKDLVTYNLTSSATTGNGRKRNGTNWPAAEIVVDTDLLRGNTLDWYCHGDNLLETIQGLAVEGGGDFEVLKVSNSTPMFKFFFYPGQLGIDRRSTVIFSVERDNMEDLAYELDRSREYTVACVWGQERGEDREYLSRTGPNYSVTNDREVYVTAAGVATTAGQQARGDARLNKIRAKEDFEFVARTGHLYTLNKDVFLGDLVNVINPYTGISLDGKVVAANLVLREDVRQTTLGIETNL